MSTEIEVEVDYLECRCFDCDHLLRISYDSGYNELCIETQLYQYQSFWKRLLSAFKYLFKKYPKGSHWDCTVLDKEKAEKLKILCDKVLNK